MFSYAKYLFLLVLKVGLTKHGKRRSPSITVSNVYFSFLSRVDVNVCDFPLIYSLLYCISVSFNFFGHLSFYQWMYFLIINLLLILLVKMVVSKSFVNILG
ncbi:hypothetical protein HanIR_Chr17g0895071 [Helianthus annuus]|nr:hypothetical protein HanIR_Chr17g0895071 [Helianthus annuus]